MAKFLRSVDQLARKPPPSANKASTELSCNDENDETSKCTERRGNNRTIVPLPASSAASASSEAIPPISQTSDHGIDESVLAIRSLAASQSREVWTTTTGVVDRVLKVVRTSVPPLLDDIKRRNDARYRQQREANHRSVDAARLASRTEWQGRIAREELLWQAKMSKAELKHRGELGAMQMRAEGAETSQRVLSSRLCSAEETIQRLESELSKTKAEAEQTRKDRDVVVLKLNGEIDDAKEREREAQSNLVDVKSKLRKAAGRYQSKVQKLSNTKDALKETQQELRTRTRNLASLRTKYREKEEECRGALRRTYDLEASLQFVGRQSPTKSSRATTRTS